MEISEGSKMLRDLAGCEPEYWAENIVEIGGSLQEPMEAIARPSQQNPKAAAEATSHGFLPSPYSFRCGVPQGSR